MKYKSGVSLIEIIIVIAILGVILAVAVPSFSTYKNNQTLKNTTADIISLLNEARSNTLLSKNSTFYSVHFETNRAVLFTGGTFDTNNSSNKEILFDSLMTVPSSSLLLNGSVVDVSFNRLTGETSQYGTIGVTLNSGAPITKTITINKLGIVSSN